MNNMLSTIKIDDRNRADFDRFCNLDECRVDEYSTEYSTEYLWATDKPFSDNVYDEGDGLCEYCCPLCGELNEDYVDDGEEALCKCRFCHAYISVELDLGKNVARASAARPLCE